MNIILGPWIGSIESEIFHFYPYVIWVYAALRNRCENFYVFSHQQHKFLYDIENINFIPVSPELSNADDHIGIMNSKISNKDYLSLLKSTKSNMNDKEIIHCYVKYTKYDTFTVPLSKKMFLPIKIDEQVDMSNNTVVITRGADLNISKRILSKIDAEEINGSYPFPTSTMLKTIQNAKMVICQCGVWTYFCNLHNIPVFSWGNDGIGLYKDGGPYHFNNKKSSVIYFDNGNIDMILSGIKNLESNL
jgi:hypothetical protein